MSPADGPVDDPLDGSTTHLGAGIRLDHFELVEHLADGVHAAVYRAVDLCCGLQVAVKFPLRRTRAEPAVYRRWRREMALLAMLDHPGILRRWYTHERHDAYVVLELVSGGNLRSWIRAAPGGLPTRQATSWGIELAEALAYLHSEGVVHSDIRPENIFVTDDLTLKLGHFGLARVTGRGRRWRRIRRIPFGSDSRTGAWARATLAPGYLSPEETLGQAPDERTDVWGWGALMFEMLTGSAARGGSDRLAVIAGHIGATPLGPLGQAPLRYPPALGHVIATALRRCPDDRFPDAGALRAALGGIGGNDGGLAEDRSGVPGPRSPYWPGGAA
jgi:serine/threonine-protein kinase